MNRFGLLCTRCAARLPFRYSDMKCTCGGTLLVDYDVEQIGRSFSKETVSKRYPSMWRYRELLPLTQDEAIVSLGEGWTPLLRMHGMEKKLPLKQLWVKREEQNPTGSFKSRGFSAAVSLLKEAGAARAAVPSNGNAASALAAYAARAGIPAYVFIPQDCPPLIVQECIQYGASTYLVDGLIHDAGAIIEEGKHEQGWVNVGTLKEAGRVEGKKTMGLELAEQLGWKFPDVIIYPTGGGSGIVGMWKAYKELKRLGWIDGDMPRFVCVQEEGCQPIVDALSAANHTAGEEHRTAPSPTGMRVPQPPDLELLLAIVKESGGTSIAVSRSDIQDASYSLGSLGVSASPEGSATWAGLTALCDSGWIRPEDTVTLFNTSHHMKYTDVRLSKQPPLIRTYADFLLHSKNL
ncbi:threonine synthase [Paenibacillus hexagrammi]|uniref:Threonine synthase n=1 Tax=Paenibacillus hexagrammi TaxID=2908839 RepID=A0ABY3SDL5_9BACL|nr:threonine synthase [Paenibacillus sp. YPD9-1]UJF31314.1 threonine synthase [Paenibacillus sp. YPD9-1]